jgi:hypothetical protein
MNLLETGNGLEKQRFGKVWNENLVLSSKGLARGGCLASDTFEIILGEHKIQCSRFQAVFISKAIHRILCSDSSIDKFEITGYRGSPELLNDLLKLMNGNSIAVNKADCHGWEMICRSLDNDELLNMIFEIELGDKDPSFFNCVSDLKFLEENGGDMENKVQFIASHFCELDESELERLKDLSVDTLERILTSPNLCLRDEDTLLEFISSLGEKYSTLYGCVECEFLTLSGINEFVYKISGEEEINLRIWNSICRRLQCDLSNRNLVGNRFKGGGAGSGEFYPSVLDRELDGIINHLTQECGGNVHEMRIVDITCSSQERGSCETVVNYHGRFGDDHWSSQNIPNSWVCFDFKEKLVSLTNYTIASLTVWRPVCWVIEGSNDGIAWKSLDSQEERGLLKVGDKCVRTFRCKCAKADEFWRFIRVRQIKNARDSDELVLCNFELFGYLRRRTAFNIR